MKATLLTSALALVALSATAAPQQTTQAAPAEQQGANVPQQTLSQPAPAKAADSPLVAAAKRTGRLGKKPTEVITNDTLLKSGGHFTTTKDQAAAPLPLPVPKPQTTAAAAARKQAPPVKKEDAKDKAQKERALKRAVADYMGESIEEIHDDPAVQEGLITKAVENQKKNEEQAQAGTGAAAPPGAPTPPPAAPPAQAQRPPS